MDLIRASSNADLEATAAVLADAFTTDPVMAWAFPDPASRPRILQAMFGLVAEHVYLPTGSCSIGEDAAALWRPMPAEDDDSFWSEHGAEFVVAVEGQAERLGMLSEAMAAHHPADPHRYLLAIGIRPSAQGRGLGGALLDYSLRGIDQRGESVYLEATSVRSRVLYERHGFEVIGEFSVADSPLLWPMWREPRRPEDPS